MPATGGVRVVGGDVGAHVLGRDELRGPAQHVLALERVDDVGDPHPVGALEDAEVDPRAAGGARLDLEVGVGGADLVEQPVDGQGLAVHGRPPGIRLAARLDEVAVVVPLEVADVVLVEQRQRAGP